MNWERVAVTVYWFGLVVAFLATAVWETYRPKRELSTPASRRWGMHGLLWAACAMLILIVLRASPLMVAIASEGKSWGVLHRIHLPWPVGAATAVLLFDLTKYGVHWLFHSIPVLWRIHQVHHSDPDFDVSTAARFHPIEALMTQGALIGTVLIFGLPAMGVLVAELLGNFSTFFEHANASLPAWLERPLRRVLVTPDMHRIHHSDEIREQSRNFGQVFPWWDYLFGTYLAEPARGAEMLVTGLEGFQHAGSLRFGFMIAAPFLRIARQSPPAR
jgi:sterol desaturase/sphingolipid hydroxylase (fatty acid hydroxylase superfamily)